MWAQMNLLRRCLLSCAFLLFILSFCYGCSSLVDSRDALEVCKSDPVCRSKMEQGGSVVSSIVGAALAATPQSAPFAPFAVSGLGLLASTLIGVHLGRKMRG